MKALDINKVIDAKPKAIFSAKIDGVAKLIQVKGWTINGVLAVVVDCKAGDNWNFDVVHGDEVEVLFRNVKALEFDSAIEFRKEVMTKNDAHFNAVRNY